MDFKTLWKVGIRLGQGKGGKGGKDGLNEKMLGHARASRRGSSKLSDDMNANKYLLLNKRRREASL